MLLKSRDLGTLRSFVGCFLRLLTNPRFGACCVVLRVLRVWLIDKLERGIHFPSSTSTNDALGGLWIRHSERSCTVPALKSILTVSIHEIKCSLPDPYLLHF